MKSRFGKILILLVAVLCAVACFVACGNDEHTHTYASGWSKVDDEYHWHAPTCNDTEEGIDKEKHSFTENAVAATCQAGGYTEYTCECGYSYKDSETPIGEHDYRTSTVVATCTTGGYTLEKCSVCGDEKRSDETPALGHKLKKYVAVEATCTTEGKTSYVECERCDYKTEPQNTGLGKHTFDMDGWDKDEYSHWRVATCDHETKKGYESAHKFVSGECECGATETSLTATEVTMSGTTVTGLSESAADTTVLVLPATATEIKAGAFAGNTKIERVILPAAMRTIQSEAFLGCTSLITVAVNDGLTTVGNAAFSGCEKLATVSLPDSVTKIGAYAFEHCSSLMIIKLPAEMGKGIADDGEKIVLGEQMFAGCSALETVELPDGIVEIGLNMFLNCISLEEVIIPETVTDIDSQAFANCISLKKIELPEGLILIGSSAFKGSGLTSVLVPDSVTRVNSYAFRDCKELTVAILSKNLSYVIGDWFSGCESLESVTLPFVGSNVSAADAVSTAIGFAFGTREPANATCFDAVTQGGKTYYIPKTLKSVTVLGGTISADAFDGCANVTEIKAAEGVTVSATKFDGCPATVEKITEEE